MERTARVPPIARELRYTSMRDSLESLGIPRVECAPSVTAHHLEAFIDAFVLASSRVRARALLRRSGWRPAVSGLVEQRLDPRVSTWDVAQSRPSRWDARFLGDGVYIADASVGLMMTLQQASAASIASCKDAIFSIRPGTLAVFLNHEWGICYCSAPDQPQQRPTPSPRR